MSYVVSKTEQLLPCMSLFQSLIDYAVWYGNLSWIKQQHHHIDLLLEKCNRLWLKTEGLNNCGGYIP